MASDIQLAMFVLQLILLPIQVLLLLACKREKQQTDAIIKEGLKQALRVIVTRRGM